MLALLLNLLNHCFEQLVDDDGGEAADSIPDDSVTVSISTYTVNVCTAVIIHAIVLSSINQSIT